MATKGRSSQNRVRGVAKKHNGEEEAGIWEIRL